MTYNSLTPRLRLPYTIVRGSLQQRMQKSMECVDKLYRDFYPKYKNGKTSYDELQKSVNNVLGKKVNVRVQSVDKDNFMRASATSLNCKSTSRITYMILFTSF